MFLIKIIIAVLIGNMLGTITGIIPGIHINMVSLFIFNMLALLLRVADPLTIGVTIVSMAITHTFTNIIPSIYLGAPDESTALCVLPGHKMLLNGEGHGAVLLTLVGSLCSLILTLPLFPILIYILRVSYPILKPFIGHILLSICIFLVLKEKHSKLWALIVFMLAGVFGILVLNSPGLDEPLFPMLSGLFGVSTLIISMIQNIKIPEQKIGNVEIDNKLAYKTIFSSVIIGNFASFLPGLGTSQAAILGSQFIKNIKEKGFLVLVGGISTVNMLASFVTWHVINKERNGAIVIVSDIVGELTTEKMVIFIGAALSSCFFAVLFSIQISKKFSIYIKKVNYLVLCLSVILFISFLVVFMSGTFGFFVFLIATSIGLIPIFKGIGKNYLMGCLLVPIILYFLL